ncbi:hypothetical protein MUA03_02365 [Enterobacteriaceae bacterium H16N7]|nr:hypothetical protein [Dryocola clanedunensis]
MSWNKDVAIQHLRTRAGGTSSSHCAQYTREAIEAGGVTLARTTHAKDYGSSLISAGFREVPPGSTLWAGDVVVIQPYPSGNPSGHMAMFDGTTWISDFRQRTMYPGPGYRRTNPPYKIYRMH